MRLRQLGGTSDVRFAYDAMRSITVTRFSVPLIPNTQPPLTQAPEPVPIHILQDFTDVVPKLAARGVRDFEFLAAQERTWSEQSMRKFPSKLRNYLAVASEVTPEVAVSLKTMIRFVKLGE